MAYQKINWANGEAGNTPLNANNLNKMDNALDDFESRIGDAEYQIATLETTTSGLTTEVNKKLNKLNPSVSGTLTSTTIKVAEIKALDSSHGVEVEKEVVVTRGSTEYHVVDNLIQLENYTTNTLIPNVRQNTDDISANANAIRTISVDLELLSGTVQGQGETIGEHTLSIAALSEQTTTNTEAIATNSEDIATLKNAGMISLESRSPLTTSTSATINGMDALGESKQNTTIESVQGSFVTNVGSAINGNIVASNSRCATSVIELQSGSVLSVDSDYYMFGAYAQTENGNIERNLAWKNVQTITTSGFYRFIVRKGDGTSNLTPSEFTITKAPTPANPISIVDASGDVTCRTEDNTQSNTITLPTLRSVGDVKDELIVTKDGGKIVRRVGTVDLGSLTWSKTSSSGVTLYTTSIADISIAGGARTCEMLCDIFSIASDGRSFANITDNMGYRGGTNSSIYFRCDSVSDETAFTTLVNGKKLYYPLATPTETTLTTSEVASILALKTYDGTTIIDSELDVTIDYVGNTKGYIDTKTDYSYTDTVIGTWADGKPLHRMVIDVNSPSTSARMTVLSSLIKSTEHSVKRIYGTITQNNNIIPLPFYLGASYYATVWVDANGIEMIVGANDYINKPCEIIVEYTINDESAISVLSEGE